MRPAIISNVQIAVVDHEKLTRDFIAHVMMYSVNRDILLFENAEAILDLAKAGKTIHMVLCEVHLPGRSGFELLQCLKEEYPQICFIAMSANPADELPATELGADAFLSRPFALKDLFNIVQRFVVESPKGPMQNLHHLQN